jgi:hypothetical protein
MDDLLDVFAITRLQATYGDVVSRQAWTELEALMLPDCSLHLDLHGGRVLEHHGPAAIGGFIAASIERFEFFLFTTLNQVATVEAGGDTATGRLYIRELRQERADHRWTTAFGLYRDEYRKVDGRWWIAGRRYSTLARTPDGGDGSTMDTFGVPG